MKISISNLKLFSVVKMEAYLTSSLEKLKKCDYGKLTLVLGNESCDLDSAVCSIVYACFLCWQHTQIKCKVCTRNKRDEESYKHDIFVPILNVNHSDYALKTEVVACLEDHGIRESMLVFRDDFDLENLAALKKTNLILVDHHVLGNRDLSLGPLVTEIVDHRPVDRSGWPYNPDTRSTIEIVGSCCSLITQRIKEQTALLTGEADFFTAFSTATDMLLAGIILDTVNFSKAVNKATPVDEQMAAFLEHILYPENTPEDIKAQRVVILDRLVCARKDVSRLSAHQLLKKDVKLSGDVLVPSLPTLVQEFLKRPNAIKETKECLELNKCRLALLLGMSLTNGLERDGALVPAQGSEDVKDKFIKFLQQWTTPSLQIHIEESSNEYVYFKQNNLSASRKQYMPIIGEFLKLQNNG